MKCGHPKCSKESVENGRCVRHQPRDYTSRSTIYRAARKQREKAREDRRQAEALARMLNLKALQSSVNRGL